MAKGSGEYQTVAEAAEEAMRKAAETPPEDPHAKVPAAGDKTVEEEVASTPQEAAEEEAETPTKGASSETEETPDSYWGHDLSDIPAERRKELLEAFKQSDEYARSQTRRAAEAEKQLEALQSAQPRETEDTSEAELNIDSVLDNLYGPVDEDDELGQFRREAAKPLLETLLPAMQLQQQTVQQLMLDRAAEVFDTTIDRLEEDFQTPVDRDALLDFMDQHNLDDVEAAYHAITAPARRNLQRSLDAERRKAVETNRTQAKREISSPVATRRTATEEVEETAPPTNLKPREAGERALKKLGIA